MKFNAALYRGAKFPVKWKGGPESEDESSRNPGFQLIGLVSIYGQYAAIEMGNLGSKQGSEFHCTQIPLLKKANAYFHGEPGKERIPKFPKN